MNRQDEATRKAMTAIVAAVALFPAGDSYEHVYSLAREHQQGMVSAALLPLAGDGLVAAASAAMLYAARNGKPVPLRARVLLIGGIAATVAANVAYGLPAGLTGALLSVWPVICYVGCVELLAWMREQLGASRPVRVASVRTSQMHPWQQLRMHFQMDRGMSCRTAARPASPISWPVPRKPSPRRSTAARSRACEPSGTP